MSAHVQALGRVKHSDCLTEYATVGYVEKRIRLRKTQYQMMQKLVESRKKTMAVALDPEMEHAPAQTVRAISRHTVRRYSERRHGSFTMHEPLAARTISILIQERGFLPCTVLSGRPPANRKQNTLSDSFDLALTVLCIMHRWQ